MTTMKVIIQSTKRPKHDLGEESLNAIQVSPQIGEEAMESAEIIQISN